MQPVTLTVNGWVRTVVVRGSETLLDVLREQMGLTGAKPGCENGDCGACTVLVDGVPQKACLLLAAMAADCRVTTVEGLPRTQLQAAFIRCNAFQCGYCTPGFLVNAHALLACVAHPSERQTQEWLESNICRCTSYEEICEAVRTAADARDNGVAGEDEMPG